MMDYIWKYMRKDQKGFTLVELLVVVVILGILATLAVQTVSGRTDQAKKAKAEANVRTVQSAVELYAIDHDALPTVSGDTTKAKWDDLMVKLTTKTGDKGPYLRVKIEHLSDGYTYSYDPTSEKIIIATKSSS